MTRTAKKLGVPGRRLSGLHAEGIGWALLLLTLPVGSINVLTFGLAILAVLSLMGVLLGTRQLWRDDPSTRKSAVTAVALGSLSLVAAAAAIVLMFIFSMGICSSDPGAWVCVTSPAI